MIKTVLLCVFLILVCVVRVENRSENVELETDLVPVLTSANLSYSVIRGSRCLLECQVDNLGQFVVLWRKGDRILSVGGLLVRKDGKVKLRDDFSLEIVDVEESDAGQYSCQLDVFGNTQSLLHNLTVLVPPYIHSWERTLEVTAGDDLTIICEATGNPAPSISWRKYETGKHLNSHSSQPDRIVIANITRTGGGLYVCTADNGVTQPVERKTRILVRHPPEVSLEETWKPNGKEFEVFLSCNLIAFPRAKISWYKNGNVKLTTSDEIDLQHSISSDDKKYSLKIEKLRERNFGLYSCRASNDLGSSEATIEISGKPRSPIFSSEMREILSGVGAVNISWSCDSFYPVTQYYLHYRQYKLQTEPRGRVWEKRVVVCDTLTPSTSSLTYHCWYSLITTNNDTLYDIKITANNIHGSSPFSRIHSFYVSTGSGEKTGKIGQSTTRRQGSEAHISPMQVLAESKDLANSGQKLICSLSGLYVALLAFWMSQTSSSVLPS